MLSGCELIKMRSAKIFVLGYNMGLERSRPR
uniref:Uncharacterized protein n=1 Tax=Anguilla anguilla TaxID=7936 RepID=A0A0E9VCH3_ANGAN